jgi:hypothetical protein
MNPPRRVQVLPTSAFATESPNASVRPIRMKFSDA